MTSQSPEPIPGWAKERAVELSNARYADSVDMGSFDALESLSAFARYIAEAARETELVMGALSHHDNCCSPAGDDTTCSCGLSDARHDLARFMPPAPVDPVEILDEIIRKRLQWNGAGKMIAEELAARGIELGRANK